ncbi:MAG: IS1595 family transposase [Hyphomonadaceae bacterium]
MEAIYTNDDAAREHIESLLWPDGPVCPRCGVIGEATLLQGKSTRPGVYNCRPCDKPFTVMVGTVYEDSHIPLHKWVYATHLMSASKKGISALQLQRMLGLGSYRTAWFLAHRIREAMGIDKYGEPLGGAGKIVEADETYQGKTKERTTASKRGKPYKGKGAGPANKRAVVALVERGGKARVFHVGQADKETVAKIIVENVHPESRLHTDESRLYTGADSHTATHETTKHSAGEYARGDVHSNSAEAFFGVFKRGMNGVYQHCDEKYLARYLKEFEFRHNTRTKLGFNDGERAALAIKGAAGKRLTLRMPKGNAAPA